MPLELVAALHVWRRYTGGTHLAILGLSLSAIETVMVVASATWDPHGGLAMILALLILSASLAVVVVGLSFWAMGPIMRHSVYRRPFFVHGCSYTCVIRKDGIFLPNPLPSSVAWALIWDLYWRATLLSLPLGFISVTFSSSWVAAMHAAGLQPFFREILTWGLLLWANWLVVSLLSFWWLIHSNCGRNSICVVPSAALQGIALLPLLDSD